MANTIKKALVEHLLYPQKYIDQVNQLQQNAKAEIILLLREFVEDGQIVPSDTEIADDYWLFCWEQWDCHQIQMYAYGLNEKEELCFKAWYADSGDDFQNGEWCEFEQYSVYNQYQNVYEIVVDHILGNFDNPQG